MKIKGHSRIESIKLGYPIWTLVYNQSDQTMLADVREDKKQKIEVWKVFLEGLKKKRIKIKMTWWEKLFGAQGEYAYAIRYEDKDDPSRYKLLQYNIKKGDSSVIEEQPIIQNDILSPSLYDLDTAHHKTIADFLGLELVTPCEYLELNRYIIISYYLRSENGLDRFLLLLEGSEKRWKVKQDADMKGFAAGAFFVVKNQLLFVANRNEICSYYLDT
ncbi:MAG: hypothetical protein AAF616_00315 [Bacteroidota bacterium]